MSAPRKKSALESMKPKLIKCTFAFFDCRSAGSMASVSKGFKDPARYYFRQLMYFRQFHGPIFQDLVRGRPTTELPSHETNRELYASLSPQEKIKFIGDQLTKAPVLFKKGYFTSPLINDAIRLDLDLAGKIVDKCADDKPTLEMGFHHFLDTMPHVNTVTEARKRLMIKFQQNKLLSESVQKTFHTVYSRKRKEGYKDRHIGCLYFQPPTEQAQLDPSFRQNQYYFVTPSKAIRRVIPSDAKCFVTPSKAKTTYFVVPPGIEKSIVGFLSFKDAISIAQVNTNFRSASEYYVDHFDFNLKLNRRELAELLLIYKKLSDTEVAAHRTGHRKRKSPTLPLTMSDIPQSSIPKNNTLTCDQLIAQNGKEITFALHSSLSDPQKECFLEHKKIPLIIKGGFFKLSFVYEAVHLNPEKTMKAIELGVLKGPALQRVFQNFLNTMTIYDPVYYAPTDIGEGHRDLRRNFSPVILQFRKMIPSKDFNHILIDSLVEQGRHSSIRIVLEDWQSLLGKQNSNGKYALQLAIEDPLISKETRDWLFKKSPVEIQELAKSWYANNAHASTPTRRFG